MRKRFWVWFLPVVILAAAAPFAYRSLTARAVAKDTRPSAITPEMMLSHQPSADREHELKALADDLKKNPRHVPILLRMAQVSRDLGRIGESVRQLHEAVELEPTNAEARLELGRALFETGDADGAIRETERLLQADPANVDALYNLGAIYGNMSQDQRARRYWEKAVAIAPDSPSGRLATDGLLKLK